MTETTNITLSGAPLSAAQPARAREHSEQDGSPHPLQHGPPTPLWRAVRATVDDVPFAAECSVYIASSTREPQPPLEDVETGLRAVIDEGRARLFVATRLDGTRGGMVLAGGREPSEWAAGQEYTFVLSVAVRPEMERQGCMTALLGQVEEEARSAGHRGLKLFVRLDNSKAIAAYQKYGFRLNGYVVMEKRFEIAP